MEMNFLMFFFYQFIGVADDSIGEPGCSNGGRKKHPTTETVRSLSANLKFPYKRTISAPGGMGLSAKVRINTPKTRFSELLFTKLSLFIKSSLNKE